MKKTFLIASFAAIATGCLFSCNPGETTYTVTFDTQGGQPAIVAQKIKPNEKATEPIDKPSRDEDEEFSGWFTEPTGYNKFNFDNPITSSITLYAHYTSTAFYIDGATDVDIYNKDKHKFIVKNKIGEPQEGFYYDLYFPEFEEGRCERFTINHETGEITDINAGEYVYGYIYAYKKQDEKVVYAFKEIEVASYDALTFTGDTVEFNESFTLPEGTGLSLIIPEYYYNEGIYTKVTKIKDNGFVKSKLEKFGNVGRSLYLSNTIEEIGNNAFDMQEFSHYNSYLNLSGSMPESLKRIGSYAFRGIGLSTNCHLDFSKSKLESIGKFAFHKSSLKNADIVLPESLTFIGESAFLPLNDNLCPDTIEFKDTYYWSKKETSQDAAYIILLNDKKSNVTNFSTTKGAYSYLDVIKHQFTTDKLDVQLISLAEKALRVVGVKNLGESDTEITIPSTITYERETYTVKEIGKGAFKDQAKLKYIYLPESLEKIDDEAFSGATELKSIYIPKNVNYLGEKLFNGCSSICKMHVDEQNKTFCNYGTGNHTIYNSKTNELLYGDQSAGYDKNISSNTTKIRANAFNGRGHLGDVVIPDSVKEIGENAFLNAFNKRVSPEFSQITFESKSRIWGLSNSSINELTYVNDSKVNATMLSNTKANFTWKQREASGGIKYTSEMIGGKLDHFAAELGTCTEKDIVIADSYNEPSIGTARVQTILSYGFANSKLTSIQLPNQLIKINLYAFQNCSEMTIIIVPKTCRHIGVRAFYGCSKLTEVYFEDPTIPWQIDDLIGSKTIEQYYNTSDASKNATKLANEYVNYEWNVLG